jgi:hypothetical protein
LSLNWNEVRKRAIEFSKDWENASSEKAEAKTFWDEFFNIFGITRKRVASFEEPVKKLGDKQGYIDLFWKGVLIVEHKSLGKDLDKAFTQALDYFPGISEEELPKYVLVSDFHRFRLYDLEEKTHFQFPLKELYKNINRFDFILGFKKQIYQDEDPVNIKAAELMGMLHDALKENRYVGHNLEIFLVRILFCLFADDTGIFPLGHFQFYIEKKTNRDGSDLGAHIANIFQILNTPENERQKNIDEELNVFPYVNGDLYSEYLPIPSFDSQMRAILLQCCHFDWSLISPAIFGSLFQSVMDQEKRRNLGAHYTSEKNIMKVIKGLFLDDLYNEFNESKNNIPKLEKLLRKLSGLKFLDPACGCGNFLIISYRELRLLEIEILKLLKSYERKEVVRDFHSAKYLETNTQLSFDIKDLSHIDVDCMYGIEIEEFPARIAEVAMWLIDHQMNILTSEEFGDYYIRIPLKKSPHIHNKNALRIDWNEIIKQEECSYILGNPPFVGKKEQNISQKDDMDLIFENMNSGVGVLDYVTSWYIKASEYIRNTKIKVAFVSTNSISQGEQVGILWNILFNKYKLKIHFAHRTFKWDNEAKGKAHVHVVIIGFANYDISAKYIYEYENINYEPHEIKAKNINPYLVDSDDIVILKRNNPLCDVPEINYGSMAIDEGILILSDEEKKEAVKNDEILKKFIRPFTGGDEFLNNFKRWCIWLYDVNPKEFSSSSFIYDKIKEVKKYRLKSNRLQTKKLADYPYLFGEIRQPDTNYILIPKVSSETRKYIPLGIIDKNVIASGSCLIIPIHSKYHFGVLSSIMHMSWMKYTCGRMKSDYQYSGTVVYNNFPWPLEPSKGKLKKVEEEVKNLLEIRKEFKDQSLADLYDPISMPKKLVDAHKHLDKAVDLCYRSQPFPTELSRLEFLFDLYKKYTNPMFSEEKKKRRK